MVVSFLSCAASRTLAASLCPPAAVQVPGLVTSGEKMAAFLMADVEAFFATANVLLVSRPFLLSRCWFLIG
jgi:hypothetical protein